MNDSNDKIKIAIIGTRGIPASYGGFETFAEELSVRLTEKGYPVTVFGRKKFFQNTSQLINIYKNVKIKYTPTIMSKYLETIINSLTSFILITKKDADIIILCNAANAPFSFICRVRGFYLITNVDGIERKRSKWNVAGKLWYRLGEITSILFSNGIIADAESIYKYYQSTYGVNSEVITYGAKSEKIERGEALNKFLLIDKEYILYVSRLEPENNALVVIKAFNEINKDKNLFLLIVGDAPYADEYKKLLKRESLNNKNIIFAGYQFGHAYKELQSNAFIYIQATEVGGTHPALIEAMSYGNSIIANGTPENIEVLGGSGLYYLRNDYSSLASKINYLIFNDECRKKFSSLAKARAAQKFSWDSITTKYEKYLGKILEIK